MKTSTHLLVVVALWGCDSGSATTPPDDGFIDVSTTDASLASPDAGLEDATAADAFAPDVAPPDVAPPDVAPETGAREVEVWYFGGVYFVPERSDVSSYPVFEATWTRDATGVGLFYNLPRMLTGNSTRVAMTGVVEGETATLSGPLGTAFCQLDERGLPRSCREDFVGIEVDLERVRREALRDDPIHVTERVMVAMQFENEPIGVIEADESLLGPTSLPFCTGPSDCPDSTCELEDDGRSYCTPPSPQRASGQPCSLDFECAPGLKCDHEARRCEPDN